MRSSRVFLHASERVFRVLIAVLCTASLFAPQGCGTEPPPPPMTLGERVNLVTGDIGTEGGTIAVERPGDPLDGLKIEVPQGAYGEARTFAISYRPVLATTLGDDVNLVSPLITIDNGGGYSERIIPVTIPIQVPDDHFAMAFYCDESTGELEAIPVLEQTSTYVKIGTCHFMNRQGNDLDPKTQRRAQATNVASGVANLVVSSAPQSELVNFNLPTDFLPGRDDWQLPNYGSTITPGGNCAGLSLTAIWYFYERTQKGQPTLFGHFDNELASSQATPGFWADDSRAMRLVSVVQNDLDTRVQERTAENDLLTAGSESPRRNFFSIALALKRTRKPQIIGLSRFGDLGHAVICYGIQGQSLLIADPNLPGDTGRKIIFSGKTFDPYVSAVGIDAGEMFDGVLFHGKTAIVPWDRLTGFWLDFAMNRIGETAFPWYVYQGRELDSEDQVTREFEIDLDSPNYVSQKKVDVTVECCGDRGLRIFQFGGLGPDTGYEASKRPPFELKPGSNLLGFYSCGTIDHLVIWPYMWNSFDWITFVYQEPTPVAPQPPEPVNMDLSVLKWCAVNVTVHGHFREPPIYDWQGTANIEYGSPYSERWFGTGSFTGNTFTAPWEGRVDADLRSAESGKIVVSVDPATLHVTSFYATRTQTDAADVEGGGVKTATISGSGLPMMTYMPPGKFAPHLECGITGQDTCSHLGAFEYRADRRPSEWITVVPWTLLIGRDCLGTEITAGIQVLFRAE